MPSASSFLDILGVNTHAGHATGTYQNSSLTVKSLSYLGIDNVRDGMRSTGMSVELLDALGAAGIKFDFVVPSDVPQYGNTGLQGFIKNLEAFNAAHPGSIVSIEGLNEFNLYEFSYQGDSSVDGAVAFQKALYAAVNGSATLADIAVINFSIGMDDKALHDAGGDLSAYADFANSHSYTHTRSEVDATQEYQLSLAQSSATKDPIVITETGYTTLESIDYLGASEASQAKLILNGLFDAYENNAQKVYLYELFDGNTANDDDKEAHFGLFHSDGTPKDAAIALHNLTTILGFGDDGSAAPADDFSYSVKGMPSKGHSLMLTKSNGAKDIVLWAEPKIWNDITNTDITNPDTMVTVKLDGVHALIYVYDPLKGTDPIAVYRNTDTFKVPVSDHPVIIEIDAKGPVVVSPTVVEATQTLTSEDFVAKIDYLAAASGLESIKLTDDGVLHVSSLATMKYMIANYQHVLSKVEGGYSFSVDLKGDGWGLTNTYDASGKMTSEVHNGYTNGQLTNTLIIYPDGSKLTEVFNAGKLSQQVEVDVAGKTTATTYVDGVAKAAYIKHSNGTAESYDYNIVGQIYTSQHQTFNAKGILIGIERSNAAGMIEKIVNDASGKLMSTYQLGTDGKEMYFTYTSGVAKSLNIYHANGTSESYDYNITGKSYTTQHQTFDAKGVLVALERMGANGKFVYTEARSGTDMVYGIYNTSGVRIETTTVHKDGSKDSYYYDAVNPSAYVYKSVGSDGVVTKSVVRTAAGEETSTKFVGGIKASVYMKHADGTADSYDYGMTGQAFTTQHQSFNAKGVLIGLERSGPNGWVQNSTYDAAGKLASTFQRDAAGKEMNFLYKNGVAVSLFIKNTNGTTEAYDYNITGKSYVTQHQTFDASGKLIGLERIGANDKLIYTEARSGTDMIYGIYNAAGVRVETTTVHKDGSKDSYYYDGVNASAYVYKSFAADGVLKQSIVCTAAGEETSTRFVDGVKMSVYLKHADGTAESYDYTALSGTSYLARHQEFSKTGSLVALQQYNKDGGLTYTETREAGETKIGVYNAAGKVTELTTVKADGTRDSFFYANDAKETVTHQIKIGATIVYTDVMTGDGKHAVTANAHGLTLEGGASNDTFVFKANASGTVVFDGGNDRITGFESLGSTQPDHIFISSDLADAYSDLTIKQNKTDVVITIDDNNSITLANMKVADLSADFLVFG